MKPLKLCVHGAAGRLGSLVIGALEEYPNIVLSAALVRGGSELIGKRCQGEVLYSAELDLAIASADLVVDFSTAQASLLCAERCCAAGRALLIGTTGHSEAERRTFAQAGERIPIALIPNTSIGMAALKSAALEISQLLPERCDIEISESHHAKKKDAPSGSALWLARALAASRSLSINSAREGARKPGELGIASLRGGDVVGEHTVHFFLDGERIEISHRVADRKIFARGALFLGQKLILRGKGFYDVDDLLG
ncbi:MAG: 4-hydroxy-tetrahydrodipicolinate reductase [Oligoflexia bacterium]|nr:4-hydroxy-tetrahydrodipicolinate reductase [Oligoflexia bacterium]